MIALSCLVGLLLRSQPDLDFKLSYENAGCTFTTLTRELAKETGWEFEVAPDAANEVVVLRATGQPAGEVFGKIGEVSYTKWEFLDDRVRVSVDRGRRDAALAESMRKQVDRLVIGLREEIEELERPPEPPDEDLEYEGESPDEVRGRKFAASLLNKVTRADLEVVIRKKSVVLSDRPNAFQRAIPSYSRPDGEWFCKMLTQVKAQMVGPDAPDYVHDMFKSNVDFGRPGLDATPISLQSHKLQIVIACDSYVQSEVGYAIQFTDSTGAALVFTDGDLGNLYISERFEDNDSEPKPPSSKWPESVVKKRVKFSQEAEKWRSARSKTADRSMSLDRESLEILSRPATYEPLRYQYGEIVLQLANEADRPVAVSLPDDIPYLVNKISVLGDFLDEVWPLEYPEAKSEWVVRNAEIEYPLLPRVNREHLESLLVKGLEGSFMPLADFCGYFFETQDPSASLFGPAVYQHFPGWLDNVSDADMTMVGAMTYGGLSASQQNRLWRGDRVSVAELSPAVFDYLVSEFVISDSLYHLDFDDPESTYHRSMVRESNGIYGLADTLRWEPTEFLPRFKQNGFLQGQNQSGMCLAVAKGDGGGVTPSIFFRNWIIRFAQRQEDREGQDPNRRSSDFRVGRYRNMNLIVHLGAGIGADWPVAEVLSIDMRNSYVVGTFPEEMMQTAREDLARLLQSKYGKYHEED